MFKQMGFAAASQPPEAWTPDGTGVLVSATLADTKNIWRVPISQANWRISGMAERLTFGTASDMQPSVAANQLVFVSVNEKLNVWGMRIDPNRPIDNGRIDPLTDDALAHTYPTISPDGTRLAFGLQRAGHRDIWVKDLGSGKEKAISIPPGPSFNPIFSPDGNTLIYRTVESQTSVAYAASLAGSGTRLICRDCSDYGWSSDERQLVLIGTAPARVSILDLETGRRIPLLNDSTHLLWNARFSPDDKWISFNATDQKGSRILVAPVRGEGTISPQDWITVADSGWDDKPRWSPDGNELYFISERDGFRCIWAQSLDDRKHPRGAAIPIFHAHESRRSLSRIGPGDLALSLSRDRLVFNMSERTGNLWMTTLGAR